MRKPAVKQELSLKEQNALIQSLNKFVKWLLKKKIINEFPNIKSTIDLPSSDADWTMRFDEKERAVSFNTFTRKKCSFDYYQSIILHEFFHLAVQKVPNKEDAVKIKDDFGDELMKLIDIQSDFFTALFYKEELGFTLVQYLKLYYEGSQVFSDRWIRKGKLERYIGTVLSICKMFLNYPNKSPSVSTYDLYLPSISPLYTEENLHVLVLKKEHIYFELINASFEDFVAMKRCYTNIDTFTFKGYVKQIIDFSTKALKLPISKQLRKEIDNL